MASAKLTAFENKRNDLLILPASSWSNAVPAIAALGSAFVAMRVGQFATTIAKVPSDRCIKRMSFATTIAKVPSVAGLHRCVKEWAVDHGVMR